MSVSDLGPTHWPWAEMQRWGRTLAGLGGLAAVLVVGIWWLRWALGSVPAPVGDVLVIAASALKAVAAVLLAVALAARTLAWAWDRQVGRQSAARWHDLVLAEEVGEPTGDLGAALDGWQVRQWAYASWRRATIGIVIACLAASAIIHMASTILIDYLRYRPGLPAGSLRAIELLASTLSNLLLALATAQATLLVISPAILRRLPPPTP